MSRTDKDMPRWASAEYYEPYHALRCRGRLGIKFGNEPCTLPTEPIRQHPAHRRVSRGACIWEPVWYDRSERRYWHCRGPRKEDRHLYWWGPDRAKTRACLKEAKKQYNCSHEVEIVERALQHRHSPGKGWWD